MLKLLINEVIVLHCILTVYRKNNCKLRYEWTTFKEKMLTCQWHDTIKPSPASLCKVNYRAWLPDWVPSRDDCPSLGNTKSDTLHIRWNCANKVWWNLSTPCRHATWWEPLHTASWHMKTSPSNTETETNCRTHEMYIILIPIHVIQI